MERSQILYFFIIYVSLSVLKISSKSGKWSPEPVRFGMEHTIFECGTRFICISFYVYVYM